MAESTLGTAIDSTGFIASVSACKSYGPTQSIASTTIEQGGTAGPIVIPRLVNFQS